nr:MAG TPA: hypothetical protein [Caudoviricetes sp.]
MQIEIFSFPKCLHFNYFRVAYFLNIYYFLNL